MTALRLRNMADPAWRGVGTEFVGRLGKDFPPGLFASEAAKFPDAQVRGRILFQSGFIPFSEFGEYEEPPGPSVVLWEMFVGGVPYQTFQVLVGPNSSEYPDLPVDDDSRYVPRAGVRIDHAENGDVHGRDLSAQDDYDITLYHHHLGLVERAALMAHFAGYSAREFDIDGPAGEVYRVRYQAAPAEIPRSGNRWTMIVRLTGYLLVDVAVPIEGPFPSIPYDKSSQFQARSGIISDTAEDGLVRTSQSYGEIVWDLTLVFPAIGDAQRLALLGHFLFYRRALFNFTSHAAETYLVQYVERPFGVIHRADRWTMTARLVGVKV